MAQDINKLFKETVIPAVERMIEKEKEHLSNLKKTRKENGNFKFAFLGYDLDAAIKTSELYLTHYNARVKEYNDYMAANK
jgi:hypothetical protein